MWENASDMMLHGRDGDNHTVSSSKAKTISIEANLFIMVNS